MGKHSLDKLQFSQATLILFIVMIFEVAIMESCYDLDKTASGFKKKPHTNVWGFWSLTKTAGCYCAAGAGAGACGAGGAA